MKSRLQRSYFREKLELLLGADPLSLAAFRMALGLIIMVDLLAQIPDVGAFYTDAGVLPRAFLFSRMFASWGFSVHMISGKTAIEMVLITIQILYAAALLFGFHTRWMA